MKKNNSSCNTCKYLKCYAILYQNYYCDHENRTDDMGKLSEQNLNVESPSWCPMGKGKSVC